MNDFGEYLEMTGFSKREAALYIALLKSGASTPTEISKIAKVKRSTAYNIIEELERQGLIAEVPKEKHKKYVALSPERIAENLRYKTETLKKVMPQLLALHGGPKSKPKVRLYDDQGGIASVYAEIIESDNREICAFLSLDSVPEKLWKEAFDKFIGLYKKPGIKVRELIHTKDKRHPYIEEVFSVPGYQGRISPEAFYNDSIIYGDCVALFSFADQFALVIESKSVADSLRSLFNLAWKQARD